MMGLLRRQSQILGSVADGGGIGEPQGAPPLWPPDGGQVGINPGGVKQLGLPAFPYQAFLEAS